MRLSPYLKLLTPDEREFFAERCGTTAKYLREIADGRRRASDELAAIIEEKSAGIVRVNEINADTEAAVESKTSNRGHDENHLRQDRE